MKRRARKKAVQLLGPGDVLLGVADLDAWAHSSATPMGGMFDAHLAGMFRTMLIDRYSTTAPPTYTGHEVTAQADPSAEEATAATIVSAAVWHAANELREPRLAAQVALEGVLAAMRFPKYAAKTRESEIDEHHES